MKAEHYLKSGLNSIDTSVANLETCIMHAVNPKLLEKIENKKVLKPKVAYETSKTYQTGDLEIKGEGLESQNSWEIQGEALVTDLSLIHI